MTNQTNQKDDREQQAYARLADSALENIRDATEVTADAISDAIAKAGDALESAGDFTTEQIASARKSLQEDLAALAENTEKSADFVHRATNPGRLASGFLSMAGALLDSASDALTAWRDRIESRLIRNTGEITGPGTLTCTNCEEQIEMEDTGRIPPCWNCHKTEFRKGY